MLFSKVSGTDIQPYDMFPDAGYVKSFFLRIFFAGPRNHNPSFRNVPCGHESKHALDFRSKPLLEGRWRSQQGPLGMGLASRFMRSGPEFIRMRISISSGGRRDSDLDLRPGGISR